MRTTAYDSAWGIPSTFKMPAFWKPIDEFKHELERGFCAHFKKESANSNAEMGPEEALRIEQLLVTFKWLSQNSSTDMKMPFDPKLLHDKRFTNQAQALLRKLMVAAPSTDFFNTDGTKLKDFNIINNLR